MKKSTRTRFIAASIAVLSLSLGSVSAQATAPTVTKPAKEKLLWAQWFGEKSRTPVNSKFWSYDIGDGYGWGNNEKQYYTISETTSQLMARAIWLLEPSSWMKTSLATSTAASYT